MYTDRNPSPFLGVCGGGGVGCYCDVLCEQWLDCDTDTVTCRIFFHATRLVNIIDSTGAASYHGFLPVLVRTCIQHMIGTWHGPPLSPLHSTPVWVSVAVLCEYMFTYLYRRREACDSDVVSPPCLESQDCQFDPTFLISSLLLFCLVLWIFLSCPFLLLAHSLDIFFPKSPFSES